MSVPGSGSVGLIRSWRAFGYEDDEEEFELSVWLP